MDAQVLARWQFGITTVYHFFFVPMTIGTAWMVAVLQTRWIRSGDNQWLRLTKFFSKLFLINFTAGVVTGIVQEFQFGMNWSEYSRFVGDIFGAPLALEALIAFFLESVFIGVWIFGWDKLPRGLHNLCMYLVALGSTISAVFILAANCFMQNPVGAVYENGRAELSDFTALFTNPFFIVTFPHQIAASLMVGGSLVAGVGAWRLAKLHKDHPEGHADEEAWRKSSRMGAWVLIAACLAVFGTGHAQAQVEAKFQPMKLAASEGLLDTTTAAGFSIVGIYTQERNSEGITEVTEVFSFEVPYVLSFLAFNDPNAEVMGINDLTEQYLNDGFLNVDGERTALQEQFSSELAEMGVDPVPNVMISYYSFRLMIGLGTLGLLVGLAILWFTRKGHYPPTEKNWQFKTWKYTMGALPFMPLFANSFGWILTEMGRQPWIVYGVLPTWTANSPNVSAGQILFSMIAFTLVYGIIAVLVLKLFFTFVAKGLPDVTPPEVSKDADQPMSFAY
ncbi:cytochrome ubiquinol oxidase subunit I [Propionimicrobium sp. PCR01-08-3]|uniref:cytochrome ubiquinol oxidase subunit I n=1 Tax=Propionimicrobium sp. PCR01-08-3 TaxID=3052086 RepID=UPI00255C684A|nr:cytochrome ubiquinol oxidase subunit I [Propionimicrobium sp. PCR01-08-3]WIY82351.1 cytochrome ubiquinol oxidase subunit I [Propionimicrobium sp. PCR01-08-3]